MPASPDTILCQPDVKKGCSACCGLFNHRRLDRRFLAGFLERNTEEQTSCFQISDAVADAFPGPVRDQASYICPFQGFVSPGRPGCLIHPGIKGEDLRDRSFFGKKICDGFLCPAHSVLTEAEKKDLICLVDDWYLYTVAVIDPESFSWIISNARDLCAGKDEADSLRQLVLSALNMHAYCLNEHPGPVFFYALPEYNLAKGGYTLTADNDRAATERESIIKTMARLVEKAGR